MADLNLRNLPAWLIKRVKVQAANRDLTLRAHCIEMLAGTAAGQHPERVLTSEPGARVTTWKTERVHGCPECGALNGHQKWCKAR
jgi:plasmid stability protein